MQTSSDRDAGVQVADYGRLLRRQAWLILLLTLLGALLAAAYTAKQAKTYEAMSAVLVKPIILNPEDAAKRTADLVNLDTESQLVHSAAVVNAAKARLKSAKSFDQLTQAVGITVPANTEVMQITFSGSTPREAQQGAQSFTDAYLKYRKDQATGDAKRQLVQFQKQSAFITSQLLDVSGKIAGTASNSPDRAYLTSQQQSLTSQLTDTRGSISRLTGFDVDPGTQVQKPELPKKASSPSLPLNIAIGLAIGGLAGLLLAMFRHRRDDRVRTVEDLEGTLGVPVFVTVPAGRQRGGPLATLSGSGATLEAYRRLRSVLLGLFAEERRPRSSGTGAEVLPTAGDGERSDGPGRVVVFTEVGNYSPSAEVGANLAVLLARGGSKVVLVDTRRNSPATAAFGLGNDRGLSDAVEHEAYGEELVQHPAGIPNLAVIGTGLGTTPVGEVMATRVGRNLLEWLQRTADYVIITTASVTSSADAQTLAPLAHAVILSVPAGTTREHEVRAASHELASVGVPFAGAVLVDRPRRGGGPAPHSRSNVTVRPGQAALSAASTSS
ncbi:MAG: Wzz/FepE/Etk N-terminal domain-containing protein [Frankiaceae bacterium]